MKKISLVLTCFIVCFLLSTNSYALKIFGIEIKYERGIKEWNADHTATFCVSRGMCSITIRGDVPAFAAQIGNVDGHAVISIPAAYYDLYPQDFENNMYEVNCQVDIPYSDAITIGFSNGMSFLPGSYPVQYDVEDDAYYVYLN